MGHDHGAAVSRRAARRGGAALALAATPLLNAAPAFAATRRSEFSVLVYRRTTGFRHLSIPDGVRAIGELGDEHGFGVDATEDPGAFTRANLRQYAAVIFLNTTGTVLDTEEQRTALQRYVRSGGGYVGIHSAADTEYDWPFYGRLVGAYFHSHPIQQAAFFDNEGPDHPATAHLDARFATFDEFYSFQTNPRTDVDVLLTIDEGTYLPDPNTTNIPFDDQGDYQPGWLPGETGYMSGKRGVPGDHPMSWTHRNLGGAAFYTALGHESYLYDQQWYRQHLLGGIRSVVGGGPS
jgi:uncharacterized protein